MCCVIADGVQAEEERGDMEKVKLDNKRILFNLLPAHVAQHFLMSNPRNMVSICTHVQAPPASIISLKRVDASETRKRGKNNVQVCPGHIRKSSAKLSQIGLKREVNTKTCLPLIFCHRLYV